MGKMNLAAVPRFILTAADNEYFLEVLYISLHSTYSATEFSGSWLGFLEGTLWETIDSIKQSCYPDEPLWLRDRDIEASVNGAIEYLGDFTKGLRRHFEHNATADEFYPMCIKDRIVIWTE